MPKQKVRVYIFQPSAQAVDNIPNSYIYFTIYMNRDVIFPHKKILAIF